MYVDVSQDKDFKPNAQGKVNHGQKMLRSDGMVAFNFANFLQKGRYDYENQIAPNYPGLQWKADRPKPATVAPAIQPQPQQYPIAPQPQYQTPTPTPYIPPQPQYQQPMPTPQPTPQAAPQPQNPQSANNTQKLVEAIENMAQRITLSIQTWGQDISMKMDRNVKSMDDTLAYLLSKIKVEEIPNLQNIQQQLAQRPAQAPSSLPPSEPIQAQPTDDDEPI